MMSLIFILVLTSMIICASIARKRHLNGVFWAFMGGLLGPIAIPFALVAKQKNDGV